MFTKSFDDFDNFSIILFKIIKANHMLTSGPIRARSKLSTESSAHGRGQHQILAFSLALTFGQGGASLAFTFALSTKSALSSLHCKATTELVVLKPVLDFFTIISSLSLLVKEWLCGPS